MSKISKTILIAAVGSLIATSAFAHSSQPDYSDCKQDRLNGGTIGGFVGAGAGAAAGKALAAASVRPEGVILGAVVGAVIGNKIGKDSVYCPTGETYVQQGGHAYGDHYYDGHKKINHEHKHNLHHGNNGGVIYYNQAPATAPVYSNGQNYVNGWYQPSQYGYYGQQYNAAPVVYSQPYQGQVYVQEYSTGPTYVPAPQYAPPVQYAPPAQYAPAAQYAPPSCGTWVCQ